MSDVTVVLEMRQSIDFILHICFTGTPITCSAGSYESGQYIHINFVAQSNTLTSSIVHDGYSSSSAMRLGSAMLYGVRDKPQSVTVNGKTNKFVYDDANKVGKNKEL